jgi:phenol 2-monooxygenase
MNVSMTNSYNMAWKLAYHLQSIASHSATLLDSYEIERRGVAAELIECDNQFSSRFSKQVDNGSGQSSLTSQEFEDVFKKINGFTTGCGIEYPPSHIALVPHQPDLVKGDQYLNGVLKLGRRLSNVCVLRHADSAPWNLQDRAIDVTLTPWHRISSLHNPQISHAQDVLASSSSRQRIDWILKEHRQKL